MPSMTLAPLPSFRELWHAMKKPALSNEMLAKTWCRLGERGFWFSRSAWSLQVIAEWRACNSRKRINTIWLPDYFCNASLAPLRERNDRLVFYPTTNEMAPDMEWCYAHVLNDKPDIFLLVHYFGQPSSAILVSELCRGNDTLLIEDAAHVLVPIPGIGENGDFVLYSPHKHFAIMDGALIVVRENGPSMLGKNPIALAEIQRLSAKFIMHSSISSWSTIIWVIKRVLQRLGVRGRKNKVPFWPDLDYDAQYFAHKKMSSLAKRLLSYQCKELKKIAQLRQNNYENWRNGLCKTSTGIKSIQSLPICETPYMAIFRVDDSEKASFYYDKLKFNKLPITTWPDLPPEVLSNPGQYTNAIWNRKTRLFFPVHHTIKQNMISKVCENLKKNINVPN